VGAWCAEHCLVGPRSNGGEVAGLFILGAAALVLIGLISPAWAAHAVWRTCWRGAYYGLSLAGGGPRPEQSLSRNVLTLDAAVYWEHILDTRNAPCHVRVSLPR